MQVVQVALTGRKVVWQGRGYGRVGGCGDIGVERWGLVGRNLEIRLCGEVFEGSFNAALETGARTRGIGGLGALAGWRSIDIVRLGLRNRLDGVIEAGGHGRTTLTGQGSAERLSPRGYGVPLLNTPVGQAKMADGTPLGGGAKLMVPLCRSSGPSSRWVCPSLGSSEGSYGMVGRGQLVCPSGPGSLGGRVVRVPRGT